ncbi:hypothetical protein QBC37DRAFT_329431 [Rhypophila decipiens]|uniref:Uncharacterized protein n=1 Tax=Rhypophila decipiens TaxID=261697 RepID=A0AAN7B157_9PEZI|nr:hypothetical protein QBC37DRAFT_329431 [Rhypophila decipiens]
MGVNQQLPQSGVSPGLIKNLSFRQHSNSAVASSSDARPPEAPVTAQPNPQLTPILEIAEPDERAWRRSFQGLCFFESPFCFHSFQTQDSENASPPGNKRENIDSGYASLASTPTQDNDQAFKLKVFSTIEVPKELDSRFFDLKVLYSQQILEAIWKDRKNRGDISMKLKYMGVDGKGAKPFIVIHCDKRAAKRVKKFFSQEHVLEDLGTDFQVHIVEGGLISLGGLEDVYVWGHKPDNTLCGTGVVLTKLKEGDPTVATLGGIVLVKVGILLRLYGVKAGHDIARAYGPEYPEQEDASDSDDDEEETRDKGDASNDMDHIRALDSAGWKAGGIVRPPLIGIVDGNVFPPEQVSDDWGLITLHLGEMPKGNYIQYMSAGSFLLSQPLFAKQVISIKKRQTTPVVVITSRGLQAGTLAANGSSMVSAIGVNFVSVFDFIPNPNSELIPGDSGSWVVKKETGKVYGHVVSVDSFGEAYIMPIQGTLDEIKSHLHDDSVVLPSESEPSVLCADSGYSTMQNTPEIDSDSD